MKRFTDSVDEIVALCMSLAGIAVLLSGLYAICIMACELAIEDLLLVAGALLGPSTGYLFGKSMPHHEPIEKRDIHVSNYNK